MGAPVGGTKRGHQSGAPVGGTSGSTKRGHQAGSPTGAHQAGAPRREHQAVAPPPCGQYTRPTQSIWYPLCNVLLHSYCLHRSVQRLAQLEALQALTTLRILADHIQDQVNQLVPVYPKTKLFSLKGWSKGVHQNGTWHVAVSPLGVPRTNCFVEVYIDAFKL